MPQCDAWLDRMHALLKQPGVVYIGLVNHTVLADAYASSGFTLYPTSFPETGCVSLMKAQAMGAIPITSRYLNSTLPEMGRFDLGPCQSCHRHRTRGGTRGGHTDTRYSLARAHRPTGAAGADQG